MDRNLLVGGCQVSAVNCVVKFDELGRQQVITLAVRM